MSRPSTAIARTMPPTPLPTALQLTPSHLARNSALTPPATVKFPPAYTSPEALTAKLKISALHEAPVQPESPLPSACQFVPVQRATLLATPVGVTNANEPPTYTSP